MPGRDVGEVEVAGLVVVEAGDLGGDDAEDHPLEPRRAAEVLGEGLQHHPVVPAPFLEAERATADRVRGEGGPQALGLLARHDRGRVVGHEEDERRERPVEPDQDGAVVRHADPGDLARASLDVGGGAGDLLEDPRAFAARRPLEGELHVGRPHDAAVLELHARSEHEGVRPVVGGDGPALGEAGPGLEPLVELHEGVEDLADDRGGGRIRRLGRVEGRRVGAEDAPQRAGRRTALRSGRARQDEQADERKEPVAARHRPPLGTGDAGGSAWSTQTRSRRGLPLGCRRRLRTSGRTAAQCIRT